MEMKFEVEKEWEEIAERRREFMLTVLEKAKEFEEMEVKLATKIRMMMVKCIRGVENTNNDKKPLLISVEDHPTERSLRWRSTLPSTFPIPYQEFSEYMCRSLNPHPPNDLDFTEEKVQSAKAALADFNSKHPDTPYTFVEMVAALLCVKDIGRYFHLNFTARPSDGNADSSYLRLFFASAGPISYGGYSVKFCCILDKEHEPCNFHTVEEEYRHLYAALPPPEYLDLNSDEEENEKEAEEEGGRVNRPRLSTHFTDAGQPVESPQFIINGGVIHPTDGSIVTCRNSFYWRCYRCIPVTIRKRTLMDVLRIHEIS